MHFVDSVAVRNLFNLSATVTSYPRAYNIYFASVLIRLLKARRSQMPLVAVVQVLLVENVMSVLVGE